MLIKKKKLIKKLIIKITFNLKIVSSNNLKKKRERERNSAASSTLKSDHSRVVVI